MERDAGITLVLIRHAIAEDRAEFARSGRSDDERPLTAKGIRRMRRAAGGLRRVLPDLDRLLTSPLVRARQTAEIVAAAYDDMDVEILEAAATGDRRKVLEELAGVAGMTIAMVGHEPHQGELTSWLLTGADAGFVTYKKGEACALGFDGAVRAGRAKLLWKIRPRQLRQLDRADAGDRRDS